DVASRSNPELPREVFLREPALHASRANQSTNFFRGPFSVCGHQIQSPRAAGRQEMACLTRLQLLLSDAEVGKSNLVWVVRGPCRRLGASNDSSSLVRVRE